MPGLINTYSDGMILDSLEWLQPTSSYRYTLNIVNSSREGYAIVNEESNGLYCKFLGFIKGHSQIEERNQCLFFILNGGSSEIWIMDMINGEKTFVCSDKEFGCNWGFQGCEFLYGEFKQFGKCRELHVYWSSDCIFHVVNIDEMLNEARKQAVIDSEECDYFDNFRVTCGPHISAIGTKNAGAVLESGTYYLAIQLETNDRGQSNVFDVSQPVYIESDDNISGQIGNMSIKLHIEGLSKQWNNVIIYVIQVTGNLTIVKKMPSASYGDDGFTFEYYGQAGQEVDISTVIDKSKIWLRGQDLMQKDGKIYFYGIKNEKNLNYQKYANNIKLEYVEYEVTIEQQLKYHFPSLLRGEVYAFGIVFKYCDGTYSPVFHIPGIPGLGNASGSTGGSSNTGFVAPNDGTTGGGSSSGSGGGTNASGGDSSTEPGADDYYNPVKVSDLDTTNQHERKRNPSDKKDRPLESDKFEEAVKTNIDNIDTTEADVIAAAACQDNPYDCDKGEETTNNDLHDVNSSVIENTNLLSGYGKDDPDPDVDTTTTLKDAASKLVEDAVKNREYVTRKKPVLNYTQESQSNPGSAVEDPESNLETETIVFTQENVGESHLTVPVGSKGTIRGDNWVDSLGNPITEQKPKVVSRGSFYPYQSVVQYPDDRDCDGEEFFPQGPQYFPRVPYTSEKPHVVSHQNGVVNKYQPDNYEYAKTFIRLMGLKVSDIHIPTDDELPKPLCPTSPFKIVYVQRTAANKSIFAKAWLQGIFTGSIYGDVQAFGRHGINSFEHVDRYIAAGDDGFSRMGEQSFDPVYLAHSPDLGADNSYLPITKVRPELKFVGSGWKHGDYAEGEKPINRMTGKQRDQAGTRISNNLNHYVSAPAGFANIVGFSYAPSDSVVTKPPGMKYTLNNRHRASSVYLETDSRLFGDELDKSFIGATLEHFFPLECSAPYVSLYRDLPDQYGSVDGLRYIDLGLVATQVHGTGTKAIEGICGDTWIGPYSKKLTSHVSNKKGNFFNPPNKPGSVCRPRSYCDSPDDIIFETMGIDFYPTKLPTSGDIYDPKNYAGLHTVAGTCGEDGLSRTAAASAAIGVSESDYYGPEVLKGLAHCIIESHINPWLLQTGEGSQVVEGKVYYPKLKDLYLDSDAPNKHPWEKSFLNRFYKLIEQPSKSQIALKTAIRTFINLIIPAGMLLNYQDIEAIFDLAATWMISPMLMAFWVLAANTLFTDKRLNMLLGIGECLRDEEGGDFDGTIEQFEDAYCRYNYDYSRVNDIQPYYAFPLPYNTCVCDECLAYDTEILMSDLSKKQIQDVIVGDFVLSYDFDKKEYVNKNVTTTWNKGEKEVYRIKFRNGTYVDATLNHKWFAINRWSNDRIEVITTKELIESRENRSQSNVKYAIAYAGNIPTIGEDFINEAEAYIIGMYIAEGSRPHTNPDWKPTFIITQLKQDGRSKIEDNLKNTRFDWKEHKTGYYLSDVKDLKDIFLNINSGACNKNIPTELFRLNKTLLEKLFEGLMDGDGTYQDEKINKDGYSIAKRSVYYSCSETLINDVSLLSNIIGQPGNIHSSLRSGFGSKKLQYRLEISDKSWLKTGNKLYIDSIEKTDNVLTFDIEVEDTGSFILAKNHAISHNCDKELTTNEIYYSPKQNLDTEIDAYRDIRMNEYNTLPANRGHLQKLFAQNNNLYCLTTDALGILKETNTGLSNQIGFQLAGQDNMLSDPQFVFEEVEGGFAGTRSPNALISTPFGIFYVDDEGSKIYQFTGSIPKEISAVGMQNFFKENLGFCNPEICYDEKTGTGNHYALGFDPRYNRILITKQDGCSTYTASYSPMGDKAHWISFHSYFPQAYLWDRDNFYSILYDKGEVWKHHVKNSYQTFYGKKYPMLLEFIAVQERQQEFTFENLTFNTKAEKVIPGQTYPAKDLDITFNKLALWNSTQGSGMLDLKLVKDNVGSRDSQWERVVENYGNPKLFKVGRRWETNQLKDLTVIGCDDMSLFLSSCECQVIPDINQGLFDCNVTNKQDGVNRQFSDDFLTFRYIFDNMDDVRLYVFDHRVNDLPEMKKVD